MNCGKREEIPHLELEMDVNPSVVREKKFFGQYWG
jgi:hypothetical protein